MSKKTSGTASPKKKRGPRDHIYLRKGSKNWYFSYRWPRDYMPSVPRARLRVEESLGTPDKNVALELAHQRLADIYRSLAMARAIAKGTAVHGDKWRQIPGKIVRHEDGSFSTATEALIITYDSNEIEIDRKPNKLSTDALLSFPIEDREHLRTILIGSSPSARDIAPEVTNTSSDKEQVLRSPNKVLSSYLTVRGLAQALDELADTGRNRGSLDKQEVDFLVALIDGDKLSGADGECLHRILQKFAMQLTSTATERKQRR